MGDESACLPVSQPPRRMQTGPVNPWPLQAPGREARALVLKGVGASLPSEAPGGSGMWVNLHVGQSDSAGMEAQQERSGVAGTRSYLN